MLDRYGQQPQAFEEYRLCRGIDRPLRSAVLRTLATSKLHNAGVMA